MLVGSILFAVNFYFSKFFYACAYICMCMCCKSREDDQVVNEKSQLKPSPANKRAATVPLGGAGAKMEGGAGKAGGGGVGEVDNYMLAAVKQKNNSQGEMRARASPTKRMQQIV
jgi:hypothetical protein